ncbi:hypothetical protein HPB48_026910 [Haemaphysalis longicornis]|uniref:Carboxylesterase type B domain-containing protein n=1 Tax=Haemaphysalis longicornis TaxID=44386 RepID=A0A9J6HDD1_HAELO|nr:hypothetical protein HPB48_026910 [Haemaphysalis longicornis]
MILPSSPGELRGMRRGKALMALVSSRLRHQQHPSGTILPIIGAVVLGRRESLVAVVVSLLVIVHPDTAMVSTTSGECVGKKVSVDGVDVYRWLGIPYAESTAGKNRFSKPRRITEKQRTMAQEPRLPCPQLVNGKVVGSEDCLHMNVWAPKGRSGAGSNRTLVLASVSYWFQRGSNNDPDWAELAAKGGDRYCAGERQFLLEVGVSGYAETSRKGKLNKVYLLAREDLAGTVRRLHGKLEPSRNLSTSIHCTGRGRNSIKLRCLRNSTLEVLLREAAKLEFRFAPTLGDLGQFSKGPALEIPEVIAGVDINQKFAVSGTLNQVGTPSKPTFLFRRGTTFNNFTRLFGVHLVETAFMGCSQGTTYLRPPIVSSPTSLSEYKALYYYHYKSVAKNTKF